MSYKAIQDVTIKGIPAVLVAAYNPYAICDTCGKSNMSHTKNCNDAPFILCEECDGRGWYEDEGKQHSCPVCDGEPKITFATVKSYAEQIDRLLNKEDSSQADQVRMFNSLTNIRSHADPDCNDSDNYRMDDPEGALDTIFALATEALKGVER